MLVTADISDGAVMHGSMGTCVMEDYREYNKIEFGYTYFTQELALLLSQAAQELAELTQKEGAQMP